MAQKSPNSGHGRNTQSPGKVVRLEALGRGPLDLHTSKVGEMSLQYFVRVLFYIGATAVGLAFMGLIGWLEAPGL
jgi:hypothetical protein